MSEGGGVVLAKDWPKVIRKWRGGAIKYLDWGPFWGNRWKSSDHWWSLRHAGLVFAEYLITKRIHPSLIRLRSRSNIMTNNQQSPIKLMGVFERKRNKNWTQSVFVILQLHCELLYPQVHWIMKDQPIWVLTRANSANVNTPSGAKHMWISSSCHGMQRCGGLEGFLFVFTLRPRVKTKSFSSFPCSNVGYI